MVDFAIIGGTGLLQLDVMAVTGRKVVKTAYGAPSDEITLGEIGSYQVAFLPRHGAHHTIPPHKVNYRANLLALQDIGAKKIIAVAAVGGIQPNLGPGVVAIPDQIIDYTYARQHTFFEDTQASVTHIDFTFPYTESLRQALIRASSMAQVAVVDHGVYAATQGPRLETAKEIDRLEQDGCTLVGMTGMPEAALARELTLDYATLAVVANYAAGRSESLISMEEITSTLKDGMTKVKKLLQCISI